MEAHASQLIVEGMDDRHSVIGLMRAHVAWPEPQPKVKPSEVPVWIEVGFSADQILEDGYLTAMLKGRGLQVLGVMFDADAQPAGRYQRLRELCLPLFPELPDELPSSGLVVENADLKRLGVWIMPDNASHGCLETFLRYLVPDESEPVWEHAVTAVSTARARGAKWRDVHLDKANLYTWLAWQDSPGQSPGLALTKRILDPTSQHANGFVEWFRSLYRL